MRIETTRLILRPWTLADAPSYETMSKDIGYNCFASPGVYLARDENDLLAKVQQRIASFERFGLGKFPIFRKIDGAFVGTCGGDHFFFEGRQEIEMGYRLLLAHWGQGYATEAAEAMTQYLLQTIKARSVYGFAVAQNKASVKVLEKIGFRHRQPIDYGGFPHELFELVGNPSIRER